MREITKTLIGRKTLAERWDFSSQSILKYEQDGILTRNPNFGVPRYYMEEIIQIEALKEINPLSPLERRKLEKRIDDLEKENAFLTDKINNIKRVIMLYAD